MKIGIFGERITLKPLAKTATGTGGYSEAYTAGNVTRWANVMNVSQARNTYAGSLNMTNVKKFEIRWDSDVEAALDKTTKLSYNSLLYSIADFKLNDDESFYTIIAVHNG